MLTRANIEAELSYACIHAIAAKAGLACELRGRHADAACIDATVMYDSDRRLLPTSKLKHVTLDLQLKATFQKLSIVNGCLRFQLDARSYKRLRGRRMAQIVLALLVLPQESREWFEVNDTEMIARKCMYWASLRGAPKLSFLAKSKSIGIPLSNRLTPAALLDILGHLSKEEFLRYVE